MIRRFMGFVGWLGAAMLACHIGVASATYPDKPITLLVPFTSGGTSDIMARMLAEHLGKVWAQSVIVQNKPGAGGVIAMTQAMRSEPDGYTLVLTSSGNTSITPYLYKKPPFDSDRDFVNIIVIGEVPFVLVVDQKSPIKTLADYLAAAKAKPRSLSLGSSGIGSHQYMAAQQFVATAGIELNLIPYKGTPQQQTDLLGGSLDSMMDNVITEIPMIRTNKVRPLAVSSAKRIRQLPDVPTFEESGVRFQSLPWYGVAAPKATPADVVQKIQHEIAAFLNDPATRAKLEDMGLVPVVSSTEEATRRVRADNKEFKNIIDRLGLELQ
uniref:Bug family tripartite tricarboxylate transporter substrate binding protein n=1 Tax=Bordetella sputigena TaxID=1416810 RepID=UPI0039EFC703